MTDLPEMTALHPSMRPVEAKGPFATQISHMKRQISEYREKAASCTTSISRLTGAMTVLDARKAAFREFNHDLSLLEDRLDERYTNISDAEAMVRLFRQTPDVPPTKLVRQSNTVSVEAQKLLLENKKLTETALGQERFMLVQKMRLRLYHDHRDICRLRRVLNKLEGGGGDYSEDEDISEKLRSRIRNLRRAIEREQGRIAALSTPQMDRHDAATAIQKAWRGYYYRIKSKGEAEPLPSTPKGDEPPQESRPGDAPAAAAEPEAPA
jgi:chromosome segregation ATPase